MNLTKFLLVIHMAAENRGWFLTDNGSTRQMIRCPMKDSVRLMCPISSLAHASDLAVSKIGTRFKIPEDLIEDIVDAADGWTPYNPRLRQMLLWATGLDA